jgi:hypothetical protein
MTNLRKSAAAITLLCASLPSVAGVYCDEIVRSLIVHTNGRIYFKSDTCSKNPCQLPNHLPEVQKAAFALMLSAKETNKPVTLYWPHLTSCTENSGDAIPESFALN